MREVRKVLELPIQKGYLDWVKLEEKLHAGTVALKLSQDMPYKVADYVNFSCIAPDPKTGDRTKWAYRLYSPKFENGKFYCSGFMLGRYPSLNAMQPVWYPHTKVDL